MYTISSGPKNDPCETPQCHAFNHRNSWTVHKHKCSLIYTIIKSPLNHNDKVYTAKYYDQWYQMPLTSP